jgi:hypothetical protein
VFEGGVTADDQENSVDSANEKFGSQEPREIQFLYIQMEFCEKSTLRYFTLLS